MQANDQQMQTYANERIRVRAEQMRALLNSCRDDKAAIEDIYDRAVNGAAWADNRTDGPPELLTQQDHLTYNAIITNLTNIIDGSGENQATLAGYVTELRGNWAAFQSACVRSI